MSKLSCCGNVASASTKTFINYSCIFYFGQTEYKKTTFMNIIITSSKKCSHTYALIMLVACDFNVPVIVPSAKLPT